MPEWMPIQVASLCEMGQDLMIVLQGGLFHNGTCLTAYTMFFNLTTQDTATSAYWRERWEVRHSQSCAVWLKG